MKGGILVIQCASCPARMAATADLPGFARALEERGWRVRAGGGRARAVCPDCTKKFKPEELARPKVRTA